MVKDKKMTPNTGKATSYTKDIALFMEHIQNTITDPNDRVKLIQSLQENLASYYKVIQHLNRVIATFDELVEEQETESKSVDVKDESKEE